MTDAWKKRVKERLAENAATGTFPRDQSELARGLDVDKTSITKMFAAQSSKLVVGICRLLAIDPPLTETSQDTEAVALVRQLTVDEQHDVADFIRRHILRHKITTP